MARLRSVNPERRWWRVSMITAPVAGLAAAAGSAGNGRPAHAGATPRSAFETLLSELNPLQYLPVVGTVYRALTGDRVSETARTVGSLVVSGLTGGPIGLAIGAGMMGVERLLGFDPERAGQAVLAAVGIGGAAGGTHTHAVSIAPVGHPAALAGADTSGAGWSPRQLAGLGVRVAEDGGLQLGAARGSDVLNGLEMERLTAPAGPGKADFWV